MLCLLTNLGTEEERAKFSAFLKTQKLRLRQENQQRHSLHGQKALRLIPLKRDCYGG